MSSAKTATEYTPVAKSDETKQIEITCTLGDLYQNATSFDYFMMALGCIGIVL